MPSLTVIRHYGRPHEATLPNGKKVYRQDRLFVQSHQEMYDCQDYDNHFIYSNPDALGSTLLCTCGSVAVVSGYEGYKEFESYHGQVLMCLWYLQYRSHSDGSH